MLKYEYENATVYITKPTDAHVENIKKATEVFLKKVIKEQAQNEIRRNSRRTGISDSNARKRDQRTKQKATAS